MSLPETVDFALYSNDPATWHGLTDIKHIKKKKLSLGDHLEFDQAHSCSEFFFL